MTKCAVIDFKRGVRKETFTSHFKTVICEPKYLIACLAVVINNRILILFVLPVLAYA